MTLRRKYNAHYPLTNIKTPFPMHDYIWNQSIDNKCNIAYFKIMDKLKEKIRNWF